MKTCSKCKQEKPLAEFYKNKAQKGGHHNYCKVCQKIAGLNDYKKHKEKRLAQQIKRYHKVKHTPEFQNRVRNQRLKDKYGITLEEKANMLANQNGSCAICYAKLDIDSRKTAVDHNHETNEIRAILCEECNQGLGRFKDSVTIMKSAIKYIKKFGGQP